MKTEATQENLSQSIEQVAGAPRSGKSITVNTDEAKIDLESTGLGVRIRVSYDIESTGLAKSLEKFDKRTADKIHKATEKTLNMKKELQRVPTTSMFTAKYE